MIPPQDYLDERSGVSAYLKRCVGRLKQIIIVWFLAPLLLIGVLYVVRFVVSLVSAGA
jgi:hypothetical protein